jgi:predicted PurR-regulated permease PerM
LAAEGAVAGSVVTVGEVLAGALLAIVLTIFATRDLDRAVDLAARRHRQPERVRAACEEALGRLRSYLRAVVVLGGVEGTIIGGTVALVSSPGLGVGIGALTFVAAFFPVVGAVVAGAVAVAAVLATAGVGPALLTLAVAVAVQQLDNDLLAPYLYGRALSLHPALVLVALTGGAALAGLAGAALAVPALSAGVGASEAWRAGRDEEEGAAPARSDDGAPAAP